MIQNVLQWDGVSVIKTEKMLITSVRDNENFRWKGKTKDNKKTNKHRKEQGITKAIVKRWELNDFVVHLS